MISYELAKELRDACFPQGLTQDEKEFANSVGVEANPHFPTLSELIEACGDRFSSLTNPPRKSYWTAKVRRPAGEKWLLAKGATPLDAVARLWLTINTPPKP